MYLTTKPENPIIFLVSLTSGFIEDERIYFWTRGDKHCIDLKLNCTAPADLQIRKVMDEHDVGDLALIRFNTTGPREAIYPAVCEGLILSVRGEDFSKYHLCQKAENVSAAYEPCTLFVKPTDLRKLPAQTHPQSEDVYRMISNPRGLALIINNQVFSPTTKTEVEREDLKDRLGSEKDVASLEMLFKALYFKVFTKTNLGRSGIIHILDEYSRYDHSAYDCFVLCLMSHGREGIFYGSDGKTVSLETVREFFSATNCRTLRGKPKLIVLQSCRGRERKTGVGKDEDLSPMKSVNVVPSLDSRLVLPSKETIPDFSDILMAYSTVNHYVSFREACFGSRFVRCLVEVFQEKAGHEDVLSMLTMVNDRLSKMGDIDSKQVGQLTSTLTKKLFFWPGMFMEALS